MNSDSETDGGGIPAEFQEFFNRLDGRRERVKADSVEAATVSADSVQLKTPDGEVVNLTGEIKNNAAVIKTKRKGK